MKTKIFKTKLLRQAYEESGPEKGETIYLGRGWPDSPRSWDKILAGLYEAGYRTIVPYLRGYELANF